MRINNNLMAMNTHRQLGASNAGSAKSIEKLSSGYRINRAGDDAAGLAISEKMRGQIRGLNQASSNAQDAISMLQTSEGALNETHAILQRMRELAVQSSTDTNTDADRSEIQKEINQLTSEMTRISDTTEFNTKKLLDGSLKDVKFQIGANQDQNMALSVNSMSAEALDVVTETTTIGSKGGGVVGVKADSNFDLNGAKLEATKGGAVGATTKGKTTGIGTGFAKNITEISSADGIVSADGGVGFKAPVLKDNKITIDATVTDIDWTKINGTAAATMEIARTDDNLTVKINLTDGNGAVSIADAIADKDVYGNYTYDNHGVKFTINAEDFALMKNDGSSKMEVDLKAHFGLTAANSDLTDKTVGTKNSWTTNTATGDKATFTGNKIDIDYSKLPDGADKVVMSGDATNLKVVLYKGGVAVSTDDFKIVKDTEFEYDNHGVKFGFNVGDSNNFEITQKIESYKTKVEVSSADPLKLEITDASGTSKSIEVKMAVGDYSVEQVRDAINAAATGITGSVATIEDGNIVLKAADTGAKSTVKIADAGGLVSLFDTGTKNGAADSIKVTLKDSSDTAVGGEKTLTAGDKSVSFKDADGNMATFTLKGYDDLANVDIAKEYAASKFEKETSGIDVSSHEAANKAITTINNAIETVSAERSKLGAVQNRLEHTIKNLDTSSENLQASESRIRDVDMAKEMMEQTKQNILSQAATAMLAQANQAPQGVLQLLR